MTLGRLEVTLLSAAGDIRAYEALLSTLALDLALLCLAGQTFRFLKAEAPLVVGQFSIFERVTGVEERLHAQLILVKVDGTQLRLVQQEVKVHVQLVEHPSE